MTALVDKEKTTSPKMGRPKADIPLDELERLSSLRCTIQEAAMHLKVGLTTLKDRLREPEYRDAWDRGNASACISLRRAQFESAMKGNVSMQIWLGKQWLGQVDSPVSEQDNRGLVKEFMEHIKSTPPKGA